MRLGNDLVRAVNLATGCLLVLGAGPMLARLPNVSSSTWGWYANLCLLLLLHCPTRGLRPGAERRRSSC